MNRDRSILFIANGGADSAAFERASRFAAATQGTTEVLLRRGGRLRSVLELAQAAAAFKPDLIYCVDLAAVPVLVGVANSRKARLIIDTGDYPSAFLRHIGAGWPKVAVARAMEELAYRNADAMVARGPHHAAVMRGQGARRVTTIPDGVDLQAVNPGDGGRLRDRFGLSDVVTVGITGNFTWYDHLGGGLGCELVRALALLREVPVHAVLVGSGPGLSRLRALASDLGVAHRLHILGRVSSADYPRYADLIDICLLTQTNEISSWIRTTGKLPAYMALGKYILASAVGTAASVLPEEMLIPYRGAWDETYPAKLAERVRELVAHPQKLRRGQELRKLAEQGFAYSVVAAEAALLIDSVLEEAAQ